MNAGVAGQVLPRRLPDHRGQVEGVHQLHVGEGLGQPPQGGHDVGHRFPIILPPVAGHQKDPAVLVVQLVEQGGGKAVARPDGGGHGVNDRVSGDEHPVGDVLPAQIVPIPGGGAEVQSGDAPHQPAVHLLRVGGVFVIGPQTRLYMAHLNLVVEGGQGPGKGGGGVPVDQHQVGFGLLQHPFHAQEAFGGDGGQGLPGLHDVQIKVGLELEHIQHGVQHLPVLGGDAAEGLHGGTALELGHQGGHFDGLRPGAENGHDADRLHFASSSPSCLGGSWFRLLLLNIKIRPETAPAAHRASSRSMAFSAPAVVSTTADRPRMALMI